MGAQPQDTPEPKREPRALPVHPFLVAAFPLLSLYSNNLNDVRLQELWRPLGISIGAACVVWTLVGLALRHARKGAVAASLLVLAFYSFGHVANLVPAPGPKRAVEIGYVLIVLTAAAAVLRSRASFRQTTLALNLASAVLVVPPMWTIGQWAFYARKMDAATRAAEREIEAFNRVVREKVKPLTAEEAAALPDIYYIILDGYAGAENLQRYHRFDNTEFVSELEKRGFHLPKRSRANYAMTWYSVPSALNMRYLDGSWAGIRAGTSLYETLRRRADENDVAQRLRRRGYRYVSLWTGTEQVRVDTADLRLDDTPKRTPGSFESQALGLSALAASEKARLAEYDRHRSYIEKGFQRLGEAARLPYPKFVFAHFSVPHPPFVFGPRGEPLNPEGRYSEDDGSQLMDRMTREEYTRGYRGQVTYVNGRILQAIDAILKGSHCTPIIIVQGDHGSRMGVVWHTTDKSDFAEPYSILNAYLVPAEARKGLYDGITPVNSFRVLLSAMFDAKLPPLPDRSYFAPSIDPTNFTDVTERIR